MGSAYLRFTKDSNEVKEFVAWWEWLAENRGERAVLRRCGTLTEVVLTPAYHRLRQAVSRNGRVYDDGLALLAGMAAKVKTHKSGSSIAEQMAAGKPENPDGTARISGLRFRRLLKAKDHEALFTPLGRVIALLNGEANIESLAQSIYFWNDKSRKNWAFDYYTKAPSEK